MKRGIGLLSMILLLGIIKEGNNLMPGIEPTLTEEEVDYTAMANEFPDLLPAMKQIPSDVQRKKKYDLFWRLKNIIGYLSYPEQKALFNSVNWDGGDTQPFFKEEVYVKEMLKNKVFENEMKSLAEYITKYEQSLPFGIGCLKRVSNKYVFESDYNNEMQKIVYSRIKRILEEQTSMHSCTAEFIEELQNILINRRKLLLNLTPSDIYINRSPSKTGLYSYDEIKLKQSPSTTAPTYYTISRIKYKEEDAKDIINLFKKYAMCQNTFTNVLGMKSIEAIVAISNMDKCRDPSPNNFAGNSSSLYENNSINYKNKKQIGINNGELVRGNGLTNNGYLLTSGFKFGTGSRQQPQNLLSGESQDFILPIAKQILNIAQNTQFTTTTTGGTMTTQIGSSINAIIDLKNFIDNEIETGKAIYFSDLHQNYIANSDNDSDISAFSLFINKEYANEIVNSINDNKIIDLLPGNNIPESESSSTFKDQSNGNYPIYLTRIISVRLEGYHPLLYIEGESAKYGKLYNLMYNYKSIGKWTGRTIQGCFGVFTSGGNGDKDACRDVMKKKCGINLDYKCKKSGFYDYINAHPPMNSIPIKCSLYFSKTSDSNYLKYCFNWIESHFIGGTLAIKPSSFFGFNLYAASNDPFPTKVGSTYTYDNPPLDDIIGSTTDIPDDIRGLGTINDIVKIDGSTSTQEGDLSYKYKQMDRYDYLDMNSSSNYLQFFSLTLLFLLI